MSSPSDAFTFKAELTPHANVDAFLEHLAGRDKELAELLSDNLGKVLDATERDRSEARKQFARCIAEALDALPEESRGGQS